MRTVRVSIVSESANERSDGPVGWVSVDDAMPAEGQLCLAAIGGQVHLMVLSAIPHPTEDGDFLAWCNTYGTFWWNGVKYDCDAEYDDDYKPTHWMAIPPPPNAEREVRT